MGRLVLILGGARSGKSSMAERMAREAGGRVVFVATAEARDDEMRRRIAAHRVARPAEWRTVEEPLNLARAVREAVRDSDFVVVDCLTLWVSNHLCRAWTPVPDPSPHGEEGSLASEGWPESVECLAQELATAASEISDAVRRSGAEVALVSNEVGLGLVPDTPLGRAYRDLLGTVNRTLAAEADRVLLMVAGLPLDVKRPAEG